MSLANEAIGQVAIGAEGALPAPITKKPPRRTLAAKADIVLNPEPR